MSEVPFRSRDAVPEKKARPLLIAVIIALIAIVAILAGVLIYLRYAPRPAPVPSPVTGVVSGSDFAHLNGPLDVALYNDKFYVTDAGNRRVVAFLETGEPLFDFTGAGTHGLQGARLVYPAGIAINSRGEVFVADSGSGKVVVFNESGRPLRFLKLPDRRKAVLKPLAIDIDAQDNIFVTEARSGNIYKLDRDERVVQTIGGGKLSFANGIAVRRNGDIYVADSNKQRVVVFSRFGRLMRTIGRRAGDRSFLPRGLAFDRGDHLLVADTLGSRIIELNEAGRETESWGSPGTGREEMLFPNGIEYAAGLLYVVDRGNNRVVIWRHSP